MLGGVSVHTWVLEPRLHAWLLGWGTAAVVAVAEAGGGGSRLGLQVCRDQAEAAGAGLAGGLPPWGQGRL